MVNICFFLHTEIHLYFNLLAKLTHFCDFMFMKELDDIKFSRKKEIFIFLEVITNL